MILDAAAYNSIRLLLGVDSEELPDATLGDALIGGAAERTVLAWVGEPAYADRPPEEQGAIRTALMYETAALALETQRQSSALTAERFSNLYSMQRDTKALDLAGWIASLHARAAAAVSQLRPARSRLAIFTTAPGRRGA